MAQKQLFSDWDDVVANERNELVFKDKNKSYGAYVLRKEHNRTLGIALIISSSVLALSIGMPAIIDMIKGATSEEVVVPVDITPIDLEAPPPVDETEPPPPPPPPPPVMETIKFTPPVVVDEEVPDEEIPPPQEEITQQVSTVTQEGSGDEIVIPDEGTGNVIGETEEAPFIVVENPPEFPGGEAKLLEWLGKNTKYPAMEKENGVSGTVYLTFVVDKTGKVKDIKVLRGVKGGPGLEKEAVRVLSNSPDWKPGRQAGRNVAVQYNLPFRFTLK